MLTPLFETGRSVNRMNEQRTSYGTEESILRYNRFMDSCLDSDCHYSEKNWTYTSSASGPYGGQSGRLAVGMHQFCQQNYATSKMLA